MRYHPLDFLLEEPDPNPSQASRQEDEGRCIGSPRPAVAGLHPPTRRMEVIAWCRDQGENLIVAMLEGTSFRDLFRVYTAYGTIDQCSFSSFRIRVSVYGEMHDMSSRRKRKKPQVELSEPANKPFPRFRHFWERGS